MSEIIKELKGQNGLLELYEDKLIIKRKGLSAKMAQGFLKGDKTIYIEQISGIELKLGTSLTNGYIQFTLIGGVEAKRGLVKAIYDENSVIIKKKHNNSALEIKDKIEHLRKEIKKGVTVIKQQSSADEIRKFKQLLNDGIISKEEFDKKKNELLGL